MNLSTLKKEAREELVKRYEPFPVEEDHSQFSEGMFIADVEDAYDFLHTLIDKVWQAAKEDHEDMQ